VSETIPEYWDTPTADPPVKARPIGWLVFVPATIGLLILPRRLGPHIARSSVLKTILVHLVGLLCPLFAVAVIEARVFRMVQELGSAHFTLGEWMRLPFVLVIEVLYDLSEPLGDAWGLLGLVGGAHVACWLVGWLLMPIIAAGESTRRAYLRAVKLTLWSTICFVPIGAMLLGAAYALHANLLELRHEEESVFALVGVIGLLYWMWLLRNLGALYSGPAEGPGWAPRHPRCNRCAYVITGLSVDGRCPECGLEVSQSLPDVRTVPAFGQARTWPARMIAFDRTAWHVLRDKDFFRNLAVYRGRQEAIRFANWCCWVAGLLTLVIWSKIMVIDVYVSDGSWPDRPGFGLLVGALVFLWPVAALKVFTVIVGWIACQLGWRDPRATTTAICYGSVLFLMAIVTLPIAICAAFAAHEYGLLDFVEELRWTPRWAGDALSCVLVAGPPSIALLWAVARQIRACRAARWAAS